MELEVKFAETAKDFAVRFNEAIKIETDVNVLEYATNVARMFHGAKFPSGYELVIDMPNCPTVIQEMFRVSYGLKKLTMKIPTDRIYNAQYFAIGHSTNHSTLEELVLPDEIKFSNFFNFANRAYRLKIVNCGLGKNGVGIDLSESTSNESCFDECRELVEVRFKKNTITKSIGFAKSDKLSRDSIKSIMNAIVNSHDITGQTLTLSKAAVDAAFLWEHEGIETPGSESPEWSDTVGNVPLWTISLA